MEQENLDHIDVVSSSEEIVREESVNFKFAQEGSKNAMIDPVMEIYIEKSTHIKESYVEATKIWIFHVEI